MAVVKKSVNGLKKILDDFIASLKRSMLPSGTVCWFYLTSVPSGWKLCDGTNGTPNLIGNYPLGATSGIGTYVPAAIPNITGSAVGAGSESVDGGAIVYSAYKAQTIGGYLGSHAYPFTFDASRCSSVYTNGCNTVTPPSIKLLPCMKE